MTLPVQLIALDLDGTLVHHDLSISSRTRAVLKEVVDTTDIRVMLATGRMSLSAIRFAKELGLREPVAAYQGAMIRDLDHTVVAHTPIALPMAQQVLALLTEMKVHINVYIDDALYVAPDNPYIAFYSKLGGTVPTLVDDLTQCLTQAPTKLLVIDETRVDTVLSEVERHFPGLLAPCKSRYNFCEIIDANASKWAAVSFMAARWGIDPQHVMAIGDQGNDVSMIRGAGIGVAMGNAPVEVQAEADFVTLTLEEDGAAHAIERFALAGVGV
jgi:Cof subfamily protein (haloacid dehalogenase superfamily)